MVTENIENHIPQYLTSGEQADLLEALKDYENRPYYTAKFGADILQGDGWSGIEIQNFHDGRRDKVKGILLSNSCDIDPDNKRDFPARLMFAPLVPLDVYAKRLANLGFTNDQLNNKLDRIRKQHVTSIFFVPKGGNLEADHIALLDDVHNLPFTHFYEETKRSKLFTLSQMGFYLFLLKLSIHFCRFQEKLSR